MALRTLYLFASAIVVVPFGLSACGSSDASPAGVGGGGHASTGTGGASAGGSTGLGGAAGGSAAGGTIGVGGSGGSSAGSGGSPAAGCTFGGGDVTAATFPNGLTLTKACSPYIIDSLPGISVADGGVLTIEAGATVKFSVNAVLVVGESGSGKLVANGTAQDPITLTSNPTNPTPAPGDWYGVDFSAGTVSGSKLSYTTVDYAGANFDGAIVGDMGLAPGVLLDHVKIDYVGDSSNGVLENDPKSNFTITNSSFNGIPTGNFAISVLAPSFAGIGAGNTYATGTLLNIAGGTVDSAVSWSNPGVPIAVTDTIKVDGASAALTVAAGTTLQFGDMLGLSVGQTSGGKLVLAGTSTSHVSLTSSDTTPAAGAWAGVSIFATGKAQASYADVRYGGDKTGTNLGNLSLESVTSAAQLTVDHSTFRDSLGWGIYVACAKTAPAGAVTVDANTTYMNDAAGNKGPGPTGTGCP